jgi:hypothetical protein
LLIRYIPASTGSADDVEIIARLRRVVWINGDHNPLEDIQRGEATDAAAIEAEKIEISARHFLSSWVDARVLSQS